ncbi:hypothetical protein CEY04_14725 [Achromobacter sp. HZ28]|nr:hypothetical protein CEY04_14725 [Achromobacter sp. HZ28]OWT78100.1 hypothetical protein CEY05_09220 [Achromobacter sp. HZ34]
MSEGDPTMNKPLRPSNTRADQDHAPRETSLNARVFPPATPVDVPNLPKKVESTRAGAAGTAGTKPDGPAVETDAEHNWADSTQPAPYKKKARTSIF